MLLCLNDLPSVMAKFSILVVLVFLHLYFAIFDQISSSVGE